MAITLKWSGRRYRVAALLFSVTCGCFFGSLDTALAQGSTTNEPPLYPPVVRQLPDGAGTLSLGDWLLYPTLNFHSFYDTNIYSSPTSPISTAGVNFNPSLLAHMTPGFTRRRSTEISAATSILSLILPMTRLIGRRALSKNTRRCEI